MAPSPHRGSGYGNYNNSPSRRNGVRRTSRQMDSYDDVGYSVLDPKGHKEKLPRPVEPLCTDVIYNAEADRSDGVVRKASEQSLQSSSANKSCSRKYVWPTMEAVMLRPASVASNLPLPLAAICAPFFDGADADAMPVAEKGTWGPIRCTRCKCYANPYFQWSSKDAGRLLCNMCGHHLEVPDGFVEEMDRSAQNDEEHPEFVHGSVDFPAPRDLDVGGSELPCIPSTCFVVEASAQAVSSGFFHAALHAIDVMLDTDTPKLQRRVALVTYSDSVCFYEMMKSGYFRKVAMVDVEDPFVPVSQHAAFVSIVDEYSRSCLRALLQLLQKSTSFAPEASVCRSDNFAASGAALRVAVDVVSQAGGGDVVMFHASSPSAGIGAMEPVPPEGSSTIQQSTFYEETLCECVKGGVAVSTIVAPAPNVEMDLKTLQWLAWRTGGDTLHLPNFNVQQSLPKLLNHLPHWAAKMQSSAYGCVVKLRCSKGLRCESLVAPWQAAASAVDGSAFELPRLAPETTFAFSLQPEIDNDGEDDLMRRRDERNRQLFVQCVVLYTNGEGEKFLRVHTTHINVVFSVRAVYQSVSIAPLMATILKQAGNLALDKRKGAKVQLKDHLLQICLTILATYRRHCYTSDVASHCLVVSRSLSLLPLFILAARKLFYSFGLAKEEVAREEFFLRLLKMPVHSILTALYPRAHALPVPSELDEGGGERDPVVSAELDARNVERALATQCPLLQEHIAKGISHMYILANGFDAWLLRTEEQMIEQHVYEAIFKVADIAREHLQDQVQPSLDVMTLGDIAAASSGADQKWQEKVRTAILFVEDEGAADMSYVEWVEFLQTHVAHMMS
mmetsp:Transcript_110552/g.174162  ORF Transcript_110552/g.174162 Transcript_110552/m.174162 type:complete len:844 (-) Transcript_110552:65-2596(-)